MVLLLVFEGAVASHTDTDIIRTCGVDCGYGTLPTSALATSDLNLSKGPPLEVEGVGVETKQGMAG